jgi:hypothetical protein
VYGQKVLVVHSYHEGQQGHVARMTQGIEEAFLGSGVERRYFHMDTKRQKDLAWKQAAGRMAAALTDRYRPDVVIAMDDNAQAFYAAEYARRPQAPLFVFLGRQRRSRPVRFSKGQCHRYPRTPQRDRVDRVAAEDRSGSPDPRHAVRQISNH